MHMSGSASSGQPDTPTTTLGRLITDAAHGAERSDAAFEIGLDMLVASLRLRIDGTQAP